MDFELISIITQIIGAIAVVISIVYLSIQIRTNTKAIKARAIFDSTHSWASINELVFQGIFNDSQFQAGNESRFSEVASKIFDPNSNPLDLTPTESIMMALGHRAIFQKLEGQYYMYKHGFLNQEIWLERRNWARGFVELPYGKKWWEDEIKQSIYSPQFIDVISGGRPVEVKLAGKNELNLDD